MDGPKSPIDPESLNVLLIGAGMYTCGRGTDGYGTVLPALLEAARSERLVRQVTACATSARSIELLRQKAVDLGKAMRIDVPLVTLPEEGNDPLAYRRAIEQSHKAGTPFDCAVVAIPDEQHYAVARELLEAGIHTLLVKPFVTRTDQARELIRLVDERQLVGMVEFHKRWDQSNLVLRDRLAAGEIGVPLYFHIEYSQRKSIPEEYFAGWVNSTNIFQYLGVHYVDLISFLTAARPLRVLALGQKSWLAGRQIDTYDSIQTIIEWQKGSTRFVSTHLTNWVDPNTSSAMSDQAIKVIGTEGRIECDQKHRGVQMVTDRRGIEDINPYFSALFADSQARLRFDGYGYQSFRTFLQDVSDVRAGRVAAAQLHAHRPSFHSSLVSTAIVQANNISLAEGSRWVTVDLDTNHAFPNPPTGA